MSIITLVTKFIRTLGVKVNKRSVAEVLIYNKGFPNLPSIVSALKHFGIQCLVVKIPRDLAQEIPFPAIAAVKLSNTTKLLILEGFDTMSGKFKTFGLKERRLTIHHFLNIWTGVVLVATAANDAADKELVKNNTKDVLKKLTYLLFFFFIAYSLLLFALNLQKMNESVLFIFTSLLAINLVGFIISVYLLRISSSSKLVSSKFCLNTRRFSCQTALNSKWSVLFGEIHLSELCVLFFSFRYLLIILSSFNYLSESIIMLWFLDLIGFGLSSYLVFLQATKLKSWCTICLSISGIIVVHLAITSFNILQFTFSASQAFEVAVPSIAGPLLIWLLIRQNFFENNELRKLKKQYLYLKNDADYIKYELSKSRQVSSEAFVASVNLSHPQSKTIVTLITNPTCVPCQEAHNKLEMLYKEYSTLIDLKIVFLVNEANDIGKIVACKIHHSQIENTRKLSLLSDWYRNYSTSNFAKWESNEFNLEEHKVLSTSFLKKNFQWSHANGIDRTPMVLVNNRIFPTALDIADLRTWFDSIQV